MQQSLEIKKEHWNHLHENQTKMQKDKLVTRLTLSKLELQLL